MQKLDADIPENYRRDLDCRIWYARGMIKFFAGDYNEAAHLLEWAIIVDSLGFVGASDVRRYTGWLELTRKPVTPKLPF